MAIFLPVSKPSAIQASLNMITGSVFIVFRLREQADELWRTATELSDAAGFPCYNREGRRVVPAGGGPPQLVDDALKKWKRKVDEGSVTAPQTVFLVHGLRRRR